jgi:hypothetical protein
MNSSLQPLLTEAILFFSDRGIAKQMLYPEFEALLEGMVVTPEFAEETIEAVFLQINNRLHVRAAVFFTIDFDLDGNINPLWDMPLRALAEKAGRGPDMGGGPIRLACLGFCSESRFRPNLWKPAQRDGRSDLLLVKEAVTRNTLGILGEDRETMAVIQAERLQMAAEDAWYGDGSVIDVPVRADNAEPETARQSAEKVATASRILEQERVSHEEQVFELKRQLEELLQLREDELATERQRHVDHLAIVQGELLDIKKELEQQQKINGSLKRDLSKLQKHSASDAE